MLLAHATVRAASRARAIAGSRIAIRTAMIPMTTSSSTRVNAARVPSLTAGSSTRVNPGPPRAARRDLTAMPNLCMPSERNINASALNRRRPVAAGCSVALFQFRLETEVFDVGYVVHDPADAVVLENERVEQIGRASCRERV